MRMILMATLAVLGGVVASAAQPIWRVVSDQSVIAFDYSLNLRPASGVFRSVSGEGTFDPAALSASRLEMRIDVTSLDLGDPVETAFALSSDWFDAQNHPEARYRLAALTPLPDGRYEALGDLTIKGKLKVIRTPVALEISDDRAVATGALSFDRRDFNVGIGPSALFIALGTEVAVRFELVAQPAPPDRE